MNATQIAQALRATEVAHAEYEKTLGHRDENWVDWYAKYMEMLFNQSVPVGSWTALTDKEFAERWYAR
jgi:hypothetical protein